MSNPILSVIKNRNFRNLWLAQITSQIAINMMAFVLAIFVYDKTKSNTAVSVMMLSIGLPAIFFGVIAGGIVDRFNKKYVLVLCNIFRAFAMIFFFFSSESIVFVYILAALISIITQFFVPAEAPSIPNLVSQDELLPANSLFTFSYYLSTISGFILSGPAIKLFGSHNIFLFMSLLLFVASFFAWKIPKDKGVKKGNFESVGHIWSDIKEGLLFIKNNIKVKEGIYLLTFSQALIGTLAALSPGFSDKVLKIDLTDASYLVMGPAAMGLIIGALWIGSFGRNYLKRRLIVNGIIMTGLAILLMSLIVRVRSHPEITLFIKGAEVIIGNLYVAIITLAVIGFSNSLINIPSNTVLQEDTEGKLRGRVYGVLTALTGGAAILPTVFAGGMADTFGVGKTLFFIGILILLIGIWQVLKQGKLLVKIK
ncbi:MAG: Major facilitator superfamily [Candidatus Gottesmanbacteria bacterium GW2011_GWC2_39_8]|uniref:Major facilitator superfamily n=1 Tax=Candidatus Gottesmanbacteria bacterium GW2011_GWC2_39_8 TaxID=1618450 RepID=A0A0G0Q5K6_9BACT|nr:MAG: Major facilitator superfamily [Candidatus Gottesmanbacteria bacterium GW2011_GWC2_39_8]